MLINRIRPNLEGVLNLSLNQIEDGLFTVRPVGGDRLALKASVWWDSEYPGREDGRPAFPVKYYLLQPMYASAFRSLGSMLSQPELFRVADNIMQVASTKFFDQENGFMPAIDVQGPVKGVHVDQLIALRYQKPGEIDRAKLVRMVEVCQSLETKLGYMAASFDLARTLRDRYHGNRVWVFLSALIHKGAVLQRDYAKQMGMTDLKDAMEHVMEVCERMHHNYFVSHEGSPELFVARTPGNLVISKRGNKNQLWSEAARVYFENYFGLN